MAVNIGPRIGIEGEAEYRKQINNITQAQKTLSAEMKATESAFNKNTSAQEKNAAKAKNLTKQVENQKKKVEELKRMTDQSAQKFGENSTQTLKWKEALANAETELNKLNKELEKTGKANFGEKLTQVGQGMQSVGQGMQSVGTTMTKYVSAPVLAAGAVAVKTAMDFETAMAKVGTIADTTQVPIGDLEKSIINLSDNTGIAATELADSVYNAISAGQDTASAVSFVETTAKLAKAGFTDTASALDVLTSIMNAYGMESKEAATVSDKLITVQNRGKTTIAQLSSSMGKVIPTASAFSVDLDNIASAYVVLTKNGISTAESTTYLNSMLNELGKSGTKASTIIKKQTGQSFTDLMKGGANLSDVLKIVKEEADKNNLSLADLFGSAEAGKAALSLMADGGYEFVDSLNAMGSSAGATQQAFDTVTDTTAEKVNQAVNKIKNVGTAIGTDLLEMAAPGIDAFGQKIGEISDWYNSLDKDTQETVSKVGVALGVGGPVVLGAGKMVEGVGKAVSSVGGHFMSLLGHSKKLEPVGTALQTLGSYAGPIALVAGSVALVAYTMSTSHWKLPNYDELMADAEELRGKFDSIQSQIDAVSNHLDGITLKVSTDTEPLKLMQYKLHECFTQSGNLKEGMEETASTIMGQLNDALGTELPTTFSDNMDANRKALEDVDAAISNHIAKLKEQAIMEAVNSEYASALTAQKEAIAAQDEAYSQLMATMSEIERIEGELAQQAQDYANGIDVDVEANANLRRELESNRELLETNKENMVLFGSAAAEATGQVNGLETAFDMLTSSDPATRAKAPEYFASITTNAKKASKMVGENLGKAIDSVSKKASKFVEDPWNVELEVTNVDKEMKAAKKQGEKIISYMTGRVNVIEGVQGAANAAKGVAVSVLSTIHGSITSITGASSVAQAAKGVAESVLSGIRGVIRSIDYGNAIQSAWSSMQSWFNNNPLTSYVNQVVQSQSSGWNWSGLFSKTANGMIVNGEQIRTVGEAGPEAIIPLSATRRGRAMNLYREVGVILGVGGGGMVKNSTTNMGGININIYPTANQSADEIADIVSRKIAGQVYSRRTVFA